ncbi:hypothetical protein G9A89_023999 [Geosiphon pyriformis]|nr:hypothetical protein G9A89_023999 [Geosiphon pyriformis]
MNSRQQLDLQTLGLNNNHFPAESAFNFYVNNKITDCLGGTVNIESTRENFYTELFQHTSLPRNYSFVPSIKEINQTIKKYTQQQFLITYADKNKRRLQTPVVTPKKIQPPTWKKTKVELLTNPSYYYTPGSAINISSADMSTSNITSIFGQFLFQSKQKRAELLGPYDFGTVSLWKVTKSEEKKSENQEFTYQNPILKTTLAIYSTTALTTLTITTTISTAATTTLTTTITTTNGIHTNCKAEKDNTQAWINNVAKAIITNNWNDTRTMQQEDTEAITTYLGCFHRNFSILQCICPLHPADLQITITNARDFEATKLKANHIQAINLVINGSSDLDSKLKQFSNSIKQKFKEYLANIN